MPMLRMSTATASATALPHHDHAMTCCLLRSEERQPGAAVQVVEACRYVASHQARVASGELPVSQQIAPITNIVFMVR